MSIPVEIYGLSTLIPEVPDGRMVLVEGGTDPAKSYFLRRLTLTAVRSGKKTTFLTSRDRAELQTQLSAEGKVDPWKEDHLDINELDGLSAMNGFGRAGGLLVIDSFSVLTLELEASRFSGLLRELRLLARTWGTTVLLGTDRGMLDQRAEAIAAHLSDGVIQFHAKEGAEGLQRYLRIPKWTDGRFVDRNVYYSFDGSRMSIDLRNRVL